MTDAITPSVGTVYVRRVDGRAPVRIGRVWSSEHFCGGGTFVRCHPTKGGVSWCTTVEEFALRYEEMPADA